MDIKPSDLLKPVNKIIRPYDCTLVAQNGPNAEGIFHLCGMILPYDSVYSGKMTLKANQKDAPVNYGFLGTNITFLAIRVTYSSTVQQTKCVDPTYDPYIEYYFQNEPMVKRTFTDIFITSGNANHRIPQIFLYNPTPDTVTLEIMAANIDDNEIAAVINQTGNITGIYYSSILSDQTEFIAGYTGSTQFEIYDYAGNLVLTVPYVQISVVEIEGNVLTIKTDHDENIVLEFLSEFNARQAHSRMTWVTKDYAKRYLTADNPPVDNTPPAFDWWANPIVAFTGVTVTKEQLINTFIKAIFDDRDGEINTLNTTVVIKKVGSINQYEEITEQGEYEIYFSISDVAGNSTQEKKTVKIYRNAPSIVFKDSSAADTMYIDDTFYYKPSGRNIINSNDILSYYVQEVRDYVDTIAVSAVTVTITPTDSLSTSGLTSSGITLVGNYTVTLHVVNSGGLSDTQVRTLHIRTSANLPSLVLFKTGYNIPTFDVLTGLTQSQFINLTVSALSVNEYDPTIGVSNIVLTGDMIFPTVSIQSPYTVTYTITNYSGIENTYQVDRVKVVNVVPYLPSPPTFVFNTWNTGYTNLISNSALTNTWLKSFMLSAVTDTTDGNIPLTNVTLTIKNSGNTVISEITEDGNYTLYFSVINSYYLQSSAIVPLLVNSNIVGGTAFTIGEYILYGGNAFE